MEHNESYWLGWLQAFADAEGCVDTGIKEIIISNTKRYLLEYYQEGLTTLGIFSRLLGPYRHTKIPNAKPIYRLRIQRRADTQKWATLIGFIHRDKRAKLSEFTLPPTKVGVDRLYHAMI